MDEAIKKSEKNIVKDTKKEFGKLLKKDHVLDKIHDKEHKLVQKIKRKTTKR